MPFKTSDALKRFAFKQVESPAKRQKMSSAASESTIAGDTPTPISAGDVTHLVAFEDLSSMVFQAAELQNFASTWASYSPMTINEHVMADSLRNCEDIANNLRDALESLEVTPVSPASAQDPGDVLHDSPKDNDNDGVDVSSIYESKYEKSLIADRAQTLTLRQSFRDSQVPHSDWYRKNNRPTVLNSGQVRRNVSRYRFPSPMAPRPGLFQNQDPERDRRGSGTTRRL